MGTKVKGSSRKNRKLLKAKLQQKDLNVHKGKASSNEFKEL